MPDMTIPPKILKGKNYLIKILQENSKIRPNKCKIIVHMFIETLKWFAVNCIEFEFVNAFKFKFLHKNESRMYVRYRDEYRVTPEHYTMSMVPEKDLKDFLNERGKFKDVRHRQYLPEGFIRNKEIF